MLQFHILDEMGISSIEINRNILLIATALVIICLTFKWMEYRELPPGPFGLPIVGHLPLLTSRPFNKVFEDLEERYGRIVSLKYGLSTYILLNDGDIAKQVVSHPSTFARTEGLSNFVPAEAGFGLAEGEKWLSQRAFVMKALKQSISEGNWEETIHEDTEEFIREMISWECEPVNYRKSLEKLHRQSLLSLLMGKTLTRGLCSSEVRIYERYSYEFDAQLRPFSFINDSPGFVVKLLNSLQVPFVKEKIKIVNNYKDFARKQIEKILDSPSLFKDKCIATYYLNELEEEAGNGERPHFSMNNLIGIMASLPGGFHTTLVSLYWLLLTVVCHPEVQRKVHLELALVANMNHRISWTERKKFPYTMATIYEVQRWVNILPFPSIRKTREPFKVSKYTIPKGAHICINLWSIARSKQFHKDAEIFRPERFLNEEGTQFQNLDTFSPFSWGKRRCPGEEVAVISLFLYFTSIMQKFQLVSPVGTSVEFECRGCIYEKLATEQKICFLNRDE